MIGAYGPHSGLDFEECREPFWQQLEEKISKIPQPEPVYITGNFKVRFQAAYKHDDGATGPFTYGKGSQFMDHNSSFNRSLCIQAMKISNMVTVCARSHSLTAGL